MYEGSVSTVKLDKGYGFIRSADQPDLFFHFSALSDALEFDESLTERRVTFNVGTGANGRMRAVDVRPAD